MLLKNITAVALGGAAGTFLRYGINLWTLPAGYPFGTLIVNISGSFLLGFLTAWLAAKPMPSWVTAGAGVGFCGGFTTMSTLASDTVLLSAADPYAPLFYLAVSIFGGLAAALIGIASGTFFTKYQAKRRAGS
ncbi:fluoride efflux transporter FluC [Alkalicoccus daliensis]|uniref:Fluoride-specific ion channel FluC n=1 Tax=Alkalicoccus daliensis TaxID=745820 RepID=A0A1H0ISE7_9BACI|nr:CrcB family protein [Alkalicoccus daliensis]SDO34272.1 camphor resistance protein CrcB [Alkalicoccus daliensis]